MPSLYHKTGSDKQCMMLGSSANLQVREKRIKTKENQKNKSKQKESC
jgi:hypothetical protein